MRCRCSLVGINFTVLCNIRMDSICIDIAEEDQVLRTELKNALKGCGYSVREFDSGYPIIGMMDGWPDVFLIDIELHDVNGMEVCKWLKSREGSKSIPVVLISRDPYLRILATSSHADGYLEEPFTAADVVQKVSEYLPPPPAT